MSLKALQWAFTVEQVFSSSQKFVLVALANFASETGKTYPQVATICRLTNQKDETVRLALKALAEAKTPTGEPIIQDTGKRYGPTQQVRVWQLPREACEFYESPAKVPGNGGLKLPPKTPENGELLAPPEDPRIRGAILKPINQGTKKRAAGAPASKKQLPEVPLLLQTPEFLAVWANWIEDRAARRKPVTPLAAKIQLEQCLKWGAEKAIQSIKHSISCNYQGLFEPRDQKLNGFQQRPITPPPSQPFRARNGNY